MKEDEDDSGEAEEPPENNAGKQEESLPDAGEENEELEWARRHVPEEPSGPCLVFRKTELHDRPPGSRKYRAGIPDISRVPV